MLIRTPSYRIHKVLDKGQTIKFRGVVVEYSVDDEVSVIEVPSRVEHEIEELNVYAPVEALYDALQSIDAKIGSIDGKVATEATQQNILNKLAVSLLAETLATLDNSAGTTVAPLDVFASNIDVADSGVLSVQLALDASAAVKFRVVRGANTLEYYLNSGNALNANAWYEFDFSVIAGDAVNVVVDVPAGAVVNAYAALVLRRR